MARPAKAGGAHDPGGVTAGRIEVAIEAGEAVSGAEPGAEEDRRDGAGRC